jgi:DNA-binding SARP family transcriptional activator
MEPFRESSYERIMRAQLKVGNRAEALRTYEKLRQLLADELGADPSPALQARYLEALRT